MKYQGKSRAHEIDFERYTCTCRYYLAYAMCAHLCLACKVYGRELFVKKTTRKYLVRSKRGPKVKTNPALQYFRSEPTTSKRALKEDSSTEEEVEDGEGEVEKETQPKKQRVDAAFDQVKRGRGRPPKVPKALEEDLSTEEREEEETQSEKQPARVASANDQVKKGRGRPPKASKSLEEDSSTEKLEKKASSKKLPKTKSIVVPANHHVKKGSQKSPTEPKTIKTA